jgi:ferrochelatase
VRPERIEDVAHHYELFDGVSPITELTQRQADGLAERLRAAGHALPVYVGMRNWHPLLADTLAEMSTAGVGRALAFIASAQGSYSSCQQYKQNVRDARAALRARGLRDVEITFVTGWHAHPLFIEVNAAHVREAMRSLPAEVRPAARLFFTAHSIPTAMADASPYREQLQESAAAVADRLQTADWRLVYQSRSGRPEDPWLGPDIVEALREAYAQGIRAAVICPIGFVCDHIEVLYDLDREAASAAAEMGLPFARAKTVNDHPLFLDMMAEVVLTAMARYGTGRPLALHTL